MDIFWHGHACFRLRGRDATIICDPTPGLGRQAADIVCVSNSHPNHTELAAIDGSPVILRGPGEYEVKGVTIRGQSTTSGPRTAGTLANTAFVIEVDDIAVCHLGDLARPLTTDQREQVGSVDVLLIPVGGDCTIDAATAVEAISLIEPRYVIPMHFGAGGDGPLAGVDRFLKEMGLSEVETQARLAVTRSSLPDTTQVILLEARR